MSVRAQDQLERLLLTLPYLSEDTEVPIAELAERVGTDERTLLRDLEALGQTDREVPGGHVDGVELLLGAQGVGARTAFFKRPMRLTRAEVMALDIGLGMLLHERPPEERVTVAAARKKLREASVLSLHNAAQGAAPAGSAAPSVAAEYVPGAAAELFGRLSAACDARRAVRIGYQRLSSAPVDARTVYPYSIVRAHHHVYVVGWCLSVTALRVFRLDRIVSVDPLDDAFDVPGDYSVQQVLRDGRVFSGELPDDVLVVRYSPVVAPWISEREGIAPDPDGTVTVRYPLADDEWAIRHVLQYGSDAVVLEPDRVRDAILARIDALVSRFPA